MSPLPLRSDRSPRRLRVAGPLTLLMPGLGHVYCGQVRRGLSIWLGLLVVTVAAAIAWARWLFVPVGPLLVGAGAWVALQGALWADLRRLTTRHGGRYRLRPINHPVAYLGVWLGLGVLPLGVCGLVIERTLVGSVAVTDRAMFPHLLPGDRVLYERGAFAGRAPEPGELVVVGDAADALVARVVARAGETVQLRDARPVVDGGPVARSAIVQMRVPRFPPDEQGRLDALEGYVEQRGERRYVVTYGRARAASRPDPTPVLLGEDEIYVLGDNRDAAFDRAVSGRVPIDAVVGRPRYIWSSLDEAGALRPGRVGLDVR